MTVEQKQRVVADRLEVSVVGTAFLLAMDRTLGGVQVQNDPLGVVERFRLPDQLSVQRHQPQQVLFARQHLRLEAVQRRGPRPHRDPRSSANRSAETSDRSKPARRR